MSGVLATVGKVAGVVSTIAALTGNPQIAAAAALVAAPAAIASPLPMEPRMTAINIFEDGRRAYIATDGAAYDPSNGRIVALGTKTVMFPAQHMAIAAAGTIGPQHVIDALDQVCFEARQQSFLRGLPAATEILRDEGHTARLWVATYDKVRAKPRLYAIASDFDPSRHDAEPMRVQEVAGWTTGLTPAQVQGALPAGYITDARADSCRLLSAQRHYAFPHLGGRCGVGGRCELFTISRRGVSVRAIIAFPETIGEWADPRKPGRVLNG